MANIVNISPEIAEAIKVQKPVVALESTIISHGLPYPDNIKLAAEVEAIIRENGAIPATIGIIGGMPTIGLTKSEVEVLAISKDVLRVSRRDIGIAIAKKQ